MPRAMGWKPSVNLLEGYDYEGSISKEPTFDEKPSGNETK